MNGERQAVAQRRTRTRGYALITGAVAVLVGCAAPAPEPDAPTRLVIAASAASTERQPGTTAAIRTLVAQAAEHDEAALDLVVDRPAGPETVATVDLVPRRGSAVERSVERRQELLGRALDDLGARLGGVAGDSGRIDVLGLLAHVARVPGQVTAVVVTSGLQTVGPLAIDALGWDLVGSAAVLDRAVAEQLLPDLTGTTVVFTGLGDVVAPQERLPERLRSRLVALWTGLCTRAGAVECRVDTEVAAGGSPASTLPVPTVAVPPDPVLALPAATGGAPAVTELPGDVLFRPDSATLLPEAEALLRSAAATLPAGAAVELVGRTATVGSAESSRAFSLQRALSCRDALVAAGVPAGRISAVGLGFDRPLVPDRDPAGRLVPEAAHRNRSVTLTIVPGGAP